MKTRMKRWCGGVGLLLVLLTGAGAHTIWPFVGFPSTTLTIVKKAAKPAEDLAEMVAGIAERDITPPVGVPKFGYSAWAREADGFRNRLKAKAFYIKPKQGEPVVIIQADLPASSLILHHRVAELVAEHTDVSFHNISILVTHTHAGPGHYLSSDFYNVFGTNKPGFDVRVFEFLAQQMASGVIEAYMTRRPAKIAVGAKDVYGAAKNRSMGAFVANHTIEDKSVSEAAAERAVNPVMTMVRLDLKNAAGDYVPAGAFSSFSVHGTGIPAFTRPYHGDVWAYYQRELEWFVDKHYDVTQPMIHGAFEATHGDNNPNYRAGLRGDLETRRIGMKLGVAAIELFQSLDRSLSDDVTVLSAMREVNVLDLDDNTSQDLCARALVGAALVGAAKGDEIFPLSYIPPFSAGSPAEPQIDECHAEKNRMLSGLQGWGLEPERYPHLLAISGVQIGGLVMMGVPFEVTFEAGNRIQAAISDALFRQDTAVQHIVVASHSNGYFGYSTTREEYSQQWYEGGHTIYGPGTTQFLATETSRLAAEMVRFPGFSEMPSEWKVTLSAQRYFPEERTVEGNMQELSVPQFVEAESNREPYWSTEVLGVNPSKLQLHESLLSVQWRQDETQPWSQLWVNGIPVDDEGYDLQIRHIEDEEEGMSQYELRWFNPGLAESEGMFRFKMNGRGGLSDYYSSIFTFDT
ncbi:hypothetical protein A9Q99_16380 [Gammaproteobacteria bacterium 45_16_T64]|nr:hypothetical protein A9Q99_16380 [Gammaproteobacteria bacterium 45_16_T64]